MLKFIILASLVVVATSQSADKSVDEVGYTSSYNNTYAVYIPEAVRPGFPIAFTFSNLLESDRQYAIESIFRSSDDEFVERSSATVAGGSTVEVELGTLPLDYDGSTEFIFNITGMTVLDSGKLASAFKDSTTRFRYEAKSLTVLIQTDKAIYQPGETVRFRGLCLNPDLRPIGGSVDYQVQDPNGNVVFLERNIALIQGVAGSELPLTNEAATGKWSITYTVQGYKQSLSFDVEFYKLPKFEVTVEGPSYMHPETEGITVKLTGRYTYGELVKGTATLTFSLQNVYGRVQPTTIRIRRTIRNFDGSEEVFLTRKEIMEVLQWDGRSRKRLVAVGKVTEGQTAIELTGISVIEVMQHKIKVNALFKLDTIKPGLDYTAYIRVSEQDGTLLMEEDRRNNQLIVEIQYRYGYIEGFNSEELQKPSILLFVIPDNGIIVLTLQARTDNFTSVTIRPYTNETAKDFRFNAQWQANRAESPSDSFLQISTTQSTVAPGEVAQFTIKAIESVSECNVQVISRGRVISQDVVQRAADEQYIFYYQFGATRSMIPNVYVLVYYVREDGEIVADQIRITVSFELQNQVTISGPSERVEVQEDVDIRIQTSAPGSFVGVRAIDESVLLLRSGNDITQERVSKDLNEYSSTFFNPIFFRYFYFPFPSGAKDAYTVFQEAGIIVLTDAFLYRSPPVIGPFLEFARGIAPSAQKVTDNDDAQSNTERSDFPETWIWDNRIAGEDGSTTISTKTPDTITSWVVTSFSISSEYGLGVSNPFKVTVFRDFFISMNLPLKVTRGEIAIVQVVVFNYFEQDLTVDLTLHINSKFIAIDLLMPGDDPVPPQQVRNFVIPAGGSYSVKYPLRFNLLGEWPIRASARSELASDAVVRQVTVKPEGIKQCYSTSALINRAKDTPEVTVDNLYVEIPDGAVYGSAFANLHVYGDILGTTMNNFQNLLRAPGGCGEQNIVTFAPDVFVTLYLNHTGLLTDEKRAEAYRHFTDGYMNQLKYKRSDGSFSAFGQRDRSGSTWLTAFVAKCFIFAQQLRPELVEDRVLNEAVKFLLSQQNENGSFTENGRVLNTRLQGGVDSALTLTAYVLIALRETYYFRETKEMIDATERARAYLESNLNGTLNDRYTLALTTYALTVSESAQAGRALAALNQLATEEGGYKFWHEETRGASTYSSDWRPPYRPAPTNDIEMTSYAMLTYTKLGDVDSAVPTLRWIISKQNDLGGYSSTQDTVIAIQALSTIAQLLPNRVPNLSITAAHTSIHGVTGEAVSFTINEGNSQVYNTEPMPASNGEVIVESQGTGIGVAQLSVCYFIPSPPYHGEPFNCSVDIVSPDNNNANINFCCALRSGDLEATGMFLFEIGLLNGFSVNEEETEQRNKEAKMVEVKDGSLNVYFDELRPLAPLCANGVLERTGDIASVQSATLSAFEYYKPDKKVTRQYNIEGLSETGVCDVCGYECLGCPGPLLSEWRPYSPCVQFCGRENSTRIQECIDPSRNVAVDISNCGLLTEPSESMSCPFDPDFPCTHDYNGLWYELPPAYGRFYRLGECRLSGNRKSPRKGIPGSKLEGSFSHVRCPEGDILSHTTECSTSLLVRIDNYAERRPTFIMYIGHYRNIFPTMSLEKLHWSPHLRATVNILNVQETVDIPISELPVGKWKLVTFVWGVDDGLKLYIGDKSLGVYSRKEFPYNLTSPSDDLNLYLGRAQYNNRRKSGFMKGVVSSLLSWDRVIRDAEVKALYKFYEPILTAASSKDEEPVLSARHLQAFAPEDLRSCFKSDSTLSDIYKLNRPMCELDFGIPDLPPVPDVFQS